MGSEYTMRLIIKQSQRFDKNAHWKNAIYFVLKSLIKLMKREYDGGGEGDQKTSTFHVRN